MATRDSHHSPPTEAGPGLLRVQDVEVHFGGVRALQGLSFELRAGEILGLIGPNGAGKTTAFNVINGFVTATGGSVQLCGEDLLGRRPDQLSHLGLARTFQHLALVPDLSVFDNVLIGAHGHGRVGWIRASLRVGVAREERRLAAIARLAVDQLGLGAVANAPCSSLGLPTLKLVEIARAVASKPRVLLLDEPANGLTHSEVHDLGERILALRDELEMSVVMVEHHMGLVRQVADRLVVMNFGAKIAEGDPTTVLADEQVLEAYLGGVSS